ncbi:MAG TPA: hypothetical protein VGH89_32180 [Pseudonocardia sp.]
MITALARGPRNGHPHSSRDDRRAEVLLGEPALELVLNDVLSGWKDAGRLGICITAQKRLASLEITARVSPAEPHELVELAIMRRSGARACFWLVNEVLAVRRMGVAATVCVTQQGRDELPNRTLPP